MHSAVLVSIPIVKYDDYFSVGRSASATIAQTAHAAILESSTFDLTDPVQLQFAYRRATFGSLLYACRNSLFELDLVKCQLLAGPKLTIDELRGSAEATLSIDTDVHKIFIVAFHDKQPQFGTAVFTLDEIRLVDVRGKAIC